MNYIRGAVNAISAPYQYYRDLPPINPSTLTGAIDVIVIQRPAANGGTDLACSPFHVRFGKWQVLRPSEKKVNVTVNGVPMPYGMKIGEAGEAFFVFETDDDVPADLITSPLLQPQTAAAKQDDDQPLEEEERHTEDPDIQEPEFLDLNATQEDDPPNLTPKQSFKHPNLTKSASRGSISHNTPALPSPPPSRTQTPDIMSEQDRIVDEALKHVKGLHIPVVEYHDDIALDIEGYHSHQEGHNHKRTDKSTDAQPGSKVSPTTPAALAHTQSMTHSTDDLASPSIPFPSFRATSEPPPDTEAAEPGTPHVSSHPNLQHIQAYSWEWGAFPQPSPMKTSFGKGGRIEGTGVGPWKPAMTSELDEEDEDDGDDTEGEDEKRQDRVREHDPHHLRSQSVPPQLEGSPVRVKKRPSREVREFEDVNEREKEGGQADELGKVFGAGGVLSVRRGDGVTFWLTIEGRKVAFELSLVPAKEEEEIRGRRNRDGRTGGVRVSEGRDEVETSRLFEEGRIDFDKFLNDKSVVVDPRLVIRWAGDQYITRADGSPLMASLIHWRDAALRHRAGRLASSRPESPPTSDDELLPNTTDSPAPDTLHNRSKSEPPEKQSQQDTSDVTTGTGGKPTSLSWAQWWSRSRRKDTEAAAGKGDRPNMRGAASAPLTGSLAGAAPSLAKAKSVSRALVKESGTAPALPSTPVQRPASVPNVGGNVAPTSRKYAKTLRLTSDQLKALNLKPGANTITFSLSTGVIACTARIFMWDSTDFVLISDIDGTITKSDGLGHVFAMIGRDWTHMGVAKLYTDITRNGYKIMYLTSRAIGQADATRDYLKGIKQNDYQLPEGPVIMSPDRLMASLHREVIMRKPEVFKMACLRDIQRLFGESARNPFYAGFGNRITDALSYRSVNVPSSRIFTIDSSGEVKLELLELAGYKSSYIHMTDLVDQMFPPIHRKWTPEFTDFNYWKMPMQEFALPDFSPPSPALSARSDTSTRSTLARLRNFSLGGARQGTIKAPPAETDLYRSMHLRQMSSFEKLSNTLTQAANGLRRSVSPEAALDSDSDVDVDLEFDLDGNRRHRARRRSMTSMPGSLDDMDDDMDDEDGQEDVEEEEGEEEGEEEVDEEAAAEEAFDDDLLAAGEMKNVPFL